jgi:hypothetical protein
LTVASDLEPPRPFEDVEDEADKLRAASCDDIFVILKFSSDLNLNKSQSFKSLCDKM